MFKCLSNLHRMINTSAVDESMRKNPVASSHVPESFFSFLSGSELGGKSVPNTALRRRSWTWRLKCGSSQQTASVFGFFWTVCGFPFIHTDLIYALPPPPFPLPPPPANFWRGSVVLRSAVWQVQVDNQQVRFCHWKQFVIELVRVYEHLVTWRLWRHASPAIAFTKWIFWIYNSVFFYLLIYTKFCLCCFYNCTSLNLRRNAGNTTWPIK